MSASEMTHVSYLFIIMAFVFGMASIVLYFTLDIRRCWRIVQGKHSAFSKEAMPPDSFLNAEQRSCEKTEKPAPVKTETLLAFEETVPLETITLVQDIVIMNVDRYR